MCTRHLERCVVCCRFRKQRIKPRGAKAATTFLFLVCVAPSAGEARATCGKSLSGNLPAAKGAIKLEVARRKMVENGGRCVACVGVLRVCVLGALVAQCCRNGVQACVACTAGTEATHTVQGAPSARRSLPHIQIHQACVCDICCRIVVCSEVRTPGALLAASPAVAGAARTAPPDAPAFDGQRSMMKRKPGEEAHAEGGQGSRQKRSSDGGALAEEGVQSAKEFSFVKHHASKHAAHTRIHSRAVRTRSDALPSVVRRAMQKALSFAP